MKPNWDMLHWTDFKYDENKNNEFGDEITISLKNNQMSTIFNVQTDLVSILKEKGEEIWYEFTIDRWTFDKYVNSVVYSEYNHPCNGNNHLRWWDHSKWINTNLGVIYYCKHQHWWVIKLSKDNLEWFNRLVRVKKDDWNEVYWIINSPSEYSLADSSFLILPVEDKLASSRLDTIQWTPDTSTVSFEDIDHVTYWNKGRKTILWTLYTSEDKKYTKLVTRDKKEKIWANLWYWNYILFKWDQEPTLLASITCTEVTIQGYDPEVHGADNNATPEDLIRKAKEQIEPKNKNDSYKWEPSYLWRYIYPWDKEANLITSKYVINWHLMELTYVEFTDYDWNIIKWFVDTVNYPSLVYILNNENNASFTQYPWSSIKIAN
jgi:hypothetical protein